MAYWLAIDRLPPGLEYNKTFGRSSDQEMLVAGGLSIAPDEFVFPASAAEPRQFSCGSETSPSRRRHCRHLAHLPGFCLIATCPVRQSGAPLSRSRFDGKGMGRLIRKALQLFTVCRHQGLCLCFRLYALGDDRDRQIVPQPQNGIDDRMRLRIRFHGRNETAVDLDTVERETLHHLHRRIAGAEIVEGNADAELLQFEQHLRSVLHVVDQRRLGDLQFQPGRIDATLRSSLTHGAVEARVGKLAG
ncbi:MAG: hypothetical protein R3C04_08490 [Hyphomonas sp.]